MDDAASKGAVGERIKPPHDRFARLRRSPLQSIHRRAEIPYRTDAELFEGYVRVLGRRPKEIFLRNARDFYRLFERRARDAQTDRGRGSWEQVARSMYAELDDERIKTKITSMRRWAELNEQAGFLRVRGERDARGAWRALRWQLLSDTGGYSSVGEATGVRAHVTHRRARRVVRKLAVRRAGACPHLDLSFSGRQMHTPYGGLLRSPDTARKGQCQDGKEERMGDRPPAHMREGGGSALAVNDSTERPGLEELRQLAREGAEPVALLEAAFRRIFDASPRLSHRRWGETLRRAVRRADRYRGGSHELGAGVGWVVERMVADREAGRFPYSLAFYVQQLDHDSRDWRRAYRREEPLRC